jgi:hypothetical protein
MRRRRRYGVRTAKSLWCPTQRQSKRRLRYGNSLWRCAVDRCPTIADEEYNVNKCRNWEAKQVQDADGKLRHVVACWDNARVGKSVLDPEQRYNCEGDHMYRSRNLVGYDLAENRTVRIGRWICGFHRRKCSTWSPPEDQPVLLQVPHRLHHLTRKYRCMNWNTDKAERREQTRQAKRGRRRWAQDTIDSEL